MGCEDDPQPDDLRVLQELLAKIRDLVWVASGDGSRYLYVNQAVEEIYGVSRAEFLADANSWLQAVHPEDKERVRAGADRLSDSGFVNMEYRILRPDGGVRWIRDRKSVLRDGQGRVIRLGGIAVDITDSKCAEQDLMQEHQALAQDHVAQGNRLRRAQHRLLDLFENAGEPMYTIAPDGAITSLNRAWERVTGYARGEWIGKSFAPLVHPEDLPLTIQSFKAAMSGKRAVRYEARYQAADGSARIAEHTLSPQLNDDGVVEDLVGIARDLTEIRRAEHEREKVDARLRQAQRVESLGILAAGIAHDFNNMLMGLVGNLDLALLELDSGSLTQDRLTTARTAAERMSELTRQLLACTQDGELQTGPVDLSELVAEMIGLMRINLPADLKIEFEPAKSLPPADADASQIRQIVLNLLQNAADACPAGHGTICVRLECLPAAGVPAYRVPPGGCKSSTQLICLEVSDTGLGIESSEKERIFDPFYSTKEGGRGLGLSVVFGAVGRHGGSVDVESKPGGGTTFRVFFPTATASDRAASAPDDDLVPGSGRILVVDDDPVGLNVACSILTRVGYTALAARNGQKALALVNAQGDRLDLVVVDLRMPGMDGGELMREILRLKPALPILLVSGYNEQYAIEWVGDRIWTAFLQKPFSAAILSRVIAKLASGS